MVAGAGDNIALFADRLKGLPFSVGTQEREALVGRGRAPQVKRIACRPMAGCPDSGEAVARVTRCSGAGSRMAEKNGGADGV